MPMNSNRSWFWPAIVVLLLAATSLAYLYWPYHRVVLDDGKVYELKQINYPAGWPAGVVLPPRTLTPVSPGFPEGVTGKHTINGIMGLTRMSASRAKSYWMQFAQRNGYKLSSNQSTPAIEWISFEKISGDNREALFITTAPVKTHLPLITYVRIAIGYSCMPKDGLPGIPDEWKR